MSNKSSAIFKSCLWGICVLLFPISSGVLSVIYSLDTIETLFLQGIFMLAAVIPPACLVLSGKWSWRKIGFAPCDFVNSKKALYFIPVLTIFIPVVIKGFHFESVEYVWGSFFLYLCVGFVEELYFRGIIPMYLSNVFSRKSMICLSTVIFGVGHIASALSGNSGFEIVLTVLNALIFGWLAIEMTVISKNILPAIFIHSFFDFETKIVAMSGTELLIAEGVRGMIMFLVALWLAMLISKSKVYENREGLPN